MTSLEIRGTRQWDAAVRKATTVNGLEIHGPGSLSLEGIEGMVNLRYLTLWQGSPTDQLYRLKALPALERVVVQVDRPSHDLDSLLECRIPTLDVYAFNARRGLELAALPFETVTELTTLDLIVFAAALIPWDCSWLARAAGLRELRATGLYAWPAEAQEALQSARQLCKLTAHANQGDDYTTELLAEQEGDYLEQWRTEMQATLPETTVQPQPWWPRTPQVPPRWDQTEIDGGAAYSTTIGIATLAELTVELHDAEDLGRILAQWNPTLAQRVSVAPDRDGIRIQARTRADLLFIEELLTLGTPDDPDPASPPAPSRALGELDVGSEADNAAVRAFVDAFLEDVGAGRIADDEAAAERWAKGMHELEASGIESLADTAVRDQLYQRLQQPLAEAGIDAEYVVQSP